jgi:hypothetical protein
MKLAVFLTLGAIAVTGFSAPAANADTYSSVTTSSGPMETETRETRTTTSVETPTVIEERPVIVTPPANETVIVKKKSHHLVKVGPVKVF